MKFNRIFLVIFLSVFLVGVVFSADPVPVPEEGTSFSEGLFGDLFVNIGKWISSSLGEGDLSVKEAQFTKDADSGINRLDFFGEGSIATLFGKTFENMAKGSFLEMDDDGNILNADLIATDDTIFDLGGESWSLSKGERVRYKNGEIRFDKGEEGDGLFQWNDNPFELVGDYFEMNKDENGNFIFKGDLKNDVFDFSGIGDGVGKFSLDRDNNVIKIFENTKAKFYGVDVETFKAVDISYSDNFNALDHAGENYLNIKRDKLNAGGSGWSFKLDEENKVFGDMMSEKILHGQDPKTRALEFSLYGGDIEIEKTFVDKQYHQLVWNNLDQEYFNSLRTEQDIAFNVKGDGLFQIDNGRVSFGSEITTKELDGLKGIEDDLTGNLFLTPHLSENSFSYDMDLDYDGKIYSINNNIFTDGNGNELLDANYPWERIRINAMELLNDPGNLEVMNEIMNERGIKPSNYVSYAANQNYEPLLKWSFEAADYVNKNNKDGFEISGEEVWMVLFQEGMAYELTLDSFEGDPYFTMYNTQIGLDTTTIPRIWNSRVDAGYIPESLELYNLEGGFGNEDPANQGQLYYAEFNNPRDAIFTLAGDFSYRKNQAEILYKEYYGEDKYNQLTDNEKLSLGYAYFNGGEGSYRSKLPTAEKSIFGKSFSNQGIHNILGNVNRVAGTYEFLKKLGIF